MDIFVKVVKRGSFF